MHKSLKIYTDGGARGNPGPAGIGAVAYGPEGEIAFEISEYIGEATNNQAEYKALISALEKASQEGAEAVEILMDSELIVRQMKGEYKVKNQGLAPLFIKAYNLTHRFKSANFSHVPREINKEADRLVNKAIDSASL